jgi:hypothetical protein
MVVTRGTHTFSYAGYSHSNLLSFLFLFLNAYVCQLNPSGQKERKRERERERDRQGKMRKEGHLF